MNPLPSTSSRPSTLSSRLYTAGEVFGWLGCAALAGSVLASVLERRRQPRAARSDPLQCGRCRTALEPAVTEDGLQGWVCPACEPTHVGDQGRTSCVFEHGACQVLAHYNVRGEPEQPPAPISTGAPPAE